MSDEELKRLDELEASATKGPWERGNDVQCRCGEWSHDCWHTFSEQAEIFPPIGECGPVATVSQGEHDNASFVAALRNAYPALRDEIERLRKVEAAAKRVTKKPQPNPAFIDAIMREDKAAAVAALEMDEAFEFMEAWNELDALAGEGGER